MNRRVFLALPLLLGATRAGAQDTIRIERVWARATPGGARNGAAYATLSSSSPDALIAASSAVADRVELHTHVQEQGVMKMTPVEQITLDPGQPVELKPGGLHIMMFGLNRPLAEGETFKLTLTFRSAGKREVEVRVEKPGAGAPSHPGAMPKHGS